MNRFYVCSCWSAKWKAFTEIELMFLLYHDDIEKLFERSITLFFIPSGGEQTLANKWTYSHSQLPFYFNVKIKTFVVRYG